jgi:hypothetical protein
MMLAAQHSSGRRHSQFERTARRPHDDLTCSVAALLLLVRLLRMQWAFVTGRNGRVESTRQQQNGRQQQGKAAQATRARAHRSGGVLVRVAGSDIRAQP